MRYLNPHAEVARLKKVAIIVALVPPCATNLEAFAMAKLMEEWPQGERDRFAAAAGANSPSMETWKQVVHAVRTRSTAEVWARYQRVS